VRGTYVEALHLAGVRVEGAQADTADRLGADAGEQQPTARRGVRARELAELPLELLEAEVEAERRGVLLEELSDLRKVRGTRVRDLG
jgi:hypothetical protein